MSGNDDQNRLSSAPLLEDSSSGTSSGMATVDVSPAPRQLEIHNLPAAEATTTGQGPQQSLRQESVTSATGGAKVNREHSSHRMSSYEIPELSQQIFNLKIH